MKIPRLRSDDQEKRIEISILEQLMSQQEQERLIQPVLNEGQKSAESSSEQRDLTKKQKISIDEMIKNKYGQAVRQQGTGENHLKESEKGDIINSAQQINFGSRNEAKKTPVQRQSDHPSFQSSLIRVPISINCIKIMVHYQPHQGQKKQIRQQFNENISIEELISLINENIKKLYGRKWFYCHITVVLNEMQLELSEQNIRGLLMRFRVAPDDPDSYLKATELLDKTGLHQEYQILIIQKYQKDRPGKIQKQQKSKMVPNSRDQSISGRSVRMQGGIVHASGDSAVTDSISWIILQSLSSN